MIDQEIRIDVWATVLIAAVTILAGALVPVVFRLFGRRRPTPAHPVGEDDVTLRPPTLETVYPIHPLGAVLRPTWTRRGGDSPSPGVALEPLFLEYHHEALQEARAQYWFSVVAATAGFAFIIFQVSRGGGSSASEQLLKSLPGVVVEVVSALYFRQASEIRKHASEFFDRLRSDHQIAIAVGVLDTVRDEALQSSGRMRLALHLVGADLPPPVATEIVPAGRLTTGGPTPAPGGDPGPGSAGGPGTGAASGGDGSPPDAVTETPPRR